MGLILRANSSEKKDMAHSIVVNISEFGQTAYLTLCHDVLLKKKMARTGH